MKSKSHSSGSEKRIVVLGAGESGTGAAILAKQKGYDMVFVDTAGRLHIDEELMDELKNIKSAVTPTEILLVIDAMTGQMPPQIAFILPGNPRVASECHVARTICRRAERHALAIVQEKEGEDLSGTQLEIGIRYLNRLSDYLFTLGRFFCHINGVDETFWLP